MIQVKKGIPVPANKPVGGRPSRYPFNDMDVGDCFDVAVKEGEAADAVLRRMRVVATGWKKRSKAECGFAVRVVEEGGTALVRVWKTTPRASKAA